MDVWEDADMPLDAEGNRADIIMDGDSIVKRMNVGALYEQYVNATSRTVANTLRNWMGGPSQAWMNNKRDQLLDFAALNTYQELWDKQQEALKLMESSRAPELLERCWAYLFRYYEIISPRMAEKAVGYTQERKVAVLRSVVEDFCRIWFPTDNPIYLPAAIELLRKEYPVCMGPVVYTGDSRIQCRTIGDVLIGSVYFATLEKTGGDYSGIASAKTQHIGIPACLNKHDKYASAARGNPGRITGESEVRALIAFTDSTNTANLMDQSNNPMAHKEVQTNILRSKTPSDLAVAVDRKKIPLGDHRMLLYVNESLFCAGIEYFVPEKPDVAPEIYYPIDDGTRKEDDDLAIAVEPDDDVEEPDEDDGSEKITEEDDSAEIEE